MSWWMFHSKSVSETLMNLLKSLEDLGIEDAIFGPFSVKKLLNIPRYYISDRCCIEFDIYYFTLYLF